MGAESRHDGDSRLPDRSPPRALFDLLGLAARAGAVVAGTDAVRRAVREAQLHRVLLATDVAPGQAAKLTPLLRARGVPYHVISSREELGAAVGRAPVSALGVSNIGLAQRIGALAAAVSPQQDP